MTELDRYLDALGEQLREAAPERTTRRFPIIRVVVATSLIVASAGALLVLPSGRGHPLNPVAEALAALTPKDQILHMRVRVDVAGRTTPTVASGFEQWSTTEPLRWRLVERLHSGELREWSYGAGVRSTLDADTDTLVREHGYHDNDPAVQIPSFFGGGTDEADAGLRARLESGKLVDVGERQVDGRRVRRLVSPEGDAAKTLRSFVYDVDPETFEPVAGAVQYLAPPEEGGRTIATIQFRVERFERLPKTAENMRSLEITPGPGVAVRDGNSPILEGSKR